MTILQNCIGLDCALQQSTSFVFVLKPICPNFTIKGTGASLELLETFVFVFCFSFMLQWSYDMRHQEKSFCETIWHNKIDNKINLLKKKDTLFSGSVFPRENYFPNKSHFLDCYTSLIISLWPLRAALWGISVTNAEVHSFGIEEGLWWLESPDSFPAFVFCVRQWALARQPPLIKEQEDGGDRGWESSAGVCSLSPHQLLTYLQEAPASPTRVVSWQ